MFNFSRGSYGPPNSNFAFAPFGRLFTAPDDNDPLDRSRPARCPHCRHRPSQTMEDGYLCSECTSAMPDEQRAIFIAAAKGFGSSKVLPVCSDSAVPTANPGQDDGHHRQRMQLQMINLNRCKNLSCAKLMTASDQFVAEALDMCEKYVYCTDCRSALVDTADTALFETTRERQVKPAPKMPSPTDNLPRFPGPDPFTEKANDPRQGAADAFAQDHIDNWYSPGQDSSSLTTRHRNTPGCVSNFSVYGQTSFNPFAKSLNYRARPGQDSSSLKTRHGESGILSSMFAYELMREPSSSPYNWPHSEGSISPGSTSGGVFSDAQETEAFTQLTSLFRAHKITPESVDDDSPAAGGGHTDGAFCHQMEEVGRIRALHGYNPLPQ